LYITEQALAYKEVGVRLLSFGSGTSPLGVHGQQKCTMPAFYSVEWTANKLLEAFKSVINLKQAKMKLVSCLVCELSTKRCFYLIKDHLQGDLHSNNSDSSSLKWIVSQSECQGWY